MTILEFPTGEGRGPLAGGAASGREPDYSDAIARHAAHQTAKLWRTQDALLDAVDSADLALMERDEARRERDRMASEVRELRIELRQLRAGRPPVAPETAAGEHTPPRRNLIDTLTLLWIGAICGLVLLTIAVYVITPAVDHLIR